MEKYFRVLVLLLLLNSYSKAQIMVDDPIPEEVLEGIIYRTENAILKFNFEMDPKAIEKAESLEHHRTLYVKKFFLDDFSDGQSNYYQLLLKVSRFPGGYNNNSKEAKQNYYIVEKPMGFRFTNYEYLYKLEKGIPIEVATPYTDTISIDLISQNYPFNDRYLVYYDHDNLRFAALSGNFFKTIMEEYWFTETHALWYRDFARFRTAQFNTRDFSIVGFPTKEDEYAEVLARSDLSMRDVLIRVPKKSYPYEPIEIIYYTNDKRKTGVEDGSYFKVTYKLVREPKNIEELLPAMEKVSIEDIRKLRKKHETFEKGRWIIESIDSFMYEE
jgi:hypothetical protein